MPDYGLGSHTRRWAWPSPTAASRRRSQSGAFIGEHGSWNRKPRVGYKVTFVPFANGKPAGQPVDFLAGFVSDDGKAWGRPVGVAHRQGARCWWPTTSATRCGGWRHAEAVEQQFPGGDGGQRQGRGLRVVEAFRRARGDALVDHVQLGVGAGAGDRAGVVDAVANRETLHVSTDGFDRAYCVPAQYLGLACFGRSVATHLGVDRVDRDRGHTHQEVARAGHGLGQGQVLQRGGVVDGAGGVVANGFHGDLSMNDAATLFASDSFDKLPEIPISFK
jgi:hypothetical protein